jgi:hypothetical protein
LIRQFLKAVVEMANKYTRNVQPSFSHKVDSLSPHQNDYQENKQQRLASMYGKRDPYTLLVGM